MRIPEKTIDEVMRNADLVEVARSFLELKKLSGNDFAGCCPFHSEKTPSFHINAAKQVYHCFGCGAGGNIVTFVKAMVNTDYLGAMRWLANRYNIDMPECDDDGGGHSEALRRRRERDDGYRLLEDAAGWFASNLNLPEAEELRQYLAERGIDAETIRKYRLGYAPDAWRSLADWAHRRGVGDEALLAVGLVTRKPEKPDHCYDRFRHRLVFPICDELSRVVGFSARVFGANPPEGGKYVNSPESDFFHKGRILYGLNFARAHFRKCGWALICEGQLDVIACHRAGLVQAVAGQGTAFTQDHAVMLRRSGVPCVHLAYDGDAAGVKATIRTVGLLQQEGMQVMITQLPAGEDPDSVFRTGGATALQQMMSVTEPAIPFVFRMAKMIHPDNTPEDNSQVASEVLQAIATITDPVAAVGHCQWLAQQLRLPESLIQSQLAVQRHALQDEKRNAGRHGQPHPGMTPLQRAANRQFSVPAAALDNRGALYPALEMLLDLAIHSHNAARELCAHEELLAELPDEAATRVLLQLIAAVHDGEWPQMVRDLPMTEAVNDPLVSRIITRPQFEDLNDADGGMPELPAVYATALNDCLGLLRKSRLSRQEHELSAQISQNPGDYSDLNRLRELARQKKQLRRRS